MQPVLQAFKRLDTSSIYTLKRAGYELPPLCDAITDPK